MKWRDNAVTDPNHQAMVRFCNAILETSQTPELINRVAADAGFVRLCRLVTAPGDAVDFTAFCNRYQYNARRIRQRLQPVARALRLDTSGAAEAVDYYADLGVAATADEQEIKRAFRQKALLMHPDKRPDGDGSEFMKLQRAYVHLNDPELRSRHDRRPQPDEKWVESELQARPQSPGPRSIRPGWLIGALTAALVVVAFFLDSYLEEYSFYRGPKSPRYMETPDPNRTGAGTLAAARHDGASGLVHPQTGDRLDVELWPPVFANGSQDESDAAADSPSGHTALSLAFGLSPAGPQTAAASEKAILEKMTGVPASADSRNAPEPAQAPAREAGERAYKENKNTASAVKKPRANTEGIPHTAVERQQKAAATAAPISGSADRAPAHAPRTLAGLQESIKVAPPAESKMPAASAEQHMQKRLTAFLENYCALYTQKNLAAFSSLFTPDATEQGKPFASMLPRYEQNFQRIDTMDYRIHLVSYQKTESTPSIDLQGEFAVNFVLSDGRQGSSAGAISMELVEIDEHTLRVKKLAYEHR